MDRQVASLGKIICVPLTGDDSDIYLYNGDDSDNFVLKLTLISVYYL